tara:strand:+ start:28 stop:849 length:822 start_codon:yes stop_codon:yes gene_type:complete
MSLCGANLNFDAITSSASDLKTSLKSKLGGAGTFTSASDLTSLVDGKVSALTAQVSGLLPELPSVPPLSFQSELTSLASFDLNTPTGILDYQSKLSSITENFGSALSGAGFSLDDLVAQAAPALSSATDLLSGGASSFDICKDCPNFELQAGATEAIQSAQESVLAQAEGALEEIATVATNVDFDAQISIATTKANAILSDPDIQAQISANISSASAQISSDIEGGITQVNESAQSIATEVAPVLEELSGKSLSAKIPSNALNKLKGKIPFPK